tara:strand:+ start:4873 stop:6171 length:1299 start_codon:yes stop_codon:yes gene_type:complete
MANNLDSNITRKVLKKFLPMFSKDCVSAKSVNRSIISDRDFDPSSGDTVDVKRPHQFTAYRNATGDLTSATADSLVAGKASATVQDYITVYTGWSNVERALKLDQLDEILKPMVYRAVSELETSLNSFILKNSAHQIGVAGTSLTTWKQVSRVDAFANEIGFPNDGNLMAQLGSFDVANLADVQAGQNNNNQNAMAWERAQLTNNIAGINYFRSNALVSHSPGTHTGTLTLSATPTQTYLVAKDTYQTSLSITGFGNNVTGAVKAGDVIQVTTAGSGYLQQQTKQTAYGEGGNEILYTAAVSADADSNGSGVATVIVNGPAIFEASGAYNTIASALASGDSVSVISGAVGSTNKPNLFYHKDAFGLCTVALPRLEGGVESSSASHEGFTMRVSKFADGVTNTQKLRIDMLPAFACYNPLLAGRLFGGTTPGQ